jgi:hypothetical protein
MKNTKLNKWYGVWQTEMVTSFHQLICFNQHLKIEMTISILR